LGKYVVVGNDYGNVTGAKRRYGIAQAVYSLLVESWGIEGLPEEWKGGGFSDSPFIFLQNPLKIVSNFRRQKVFLSTP
jgi:hypothetical protein